MNDDAKKVKNAMKITKSTIKIFDKPLKEPKSK
jgi:hypothetical protein